MSRTPLFSGKRRLLVLLSDVVLFVLAYAGAYLIRMDLMLTNAAWHQFGRTVMPLVLVKAAGVRPGGHLPRRDALRDHDRPRAHRAQRKFASIAGAALLGLLPAPAPSPGACWSSTGC